ncbi:MAG: thioesterase family protein [Solirubrobacterales bacterium]|nr:thioesterase family protein [Solirubrobacterales bacterium]MBV9838638.1 thioesterase family protein [Solirubrobacterales bacterium]
MSAAVFVAKADGRFCATELTRGPWDPRAQHGGAPAALLAREFERAMPDRELAIARITYEFLRPVALGEVTVSCGLIRAGKRVQLLEGSLTVEGEEAVRARALRVRRSPLAGPAEPAPTVPGPEQGREHEFPGEGRMFATDAMEIRFVQGDFFEPGPAAAWFRLRHPLIEGEAPTPLQRLAAAGDFGNGISAVLSWERHSFINPDLTLLIEREPVGEWICLQSQTRISEGGAGASDSVLSDQQGRVGRALQTLLVSQR